MFGANRKKFMEGGVESDYADDSSLYYSQQSMFSPHRSDKDVSPRLMVLDGVPFMLKKICMDFVFHLSADVVVVFCFHDGSTVTAGHQFVWSTE